MVSARNYWSTDELWRDYHYWNWRARQMTAYPGFGVTHVDINAARMNAKASYDVLTKRRHGLNCPDMAAQLSVEHYTATFKRPNVARPSR